MSDDKAQVKIGADIAELRTAINEATATVKSGMDKMQSDMNASMANASGSGFTSMLSSMKSALVEVAAPLATFFGLFESGKKLIDVTREFDKINAALLTTTGSTEKAAFAFGALEDFAAKTPYNLQEVSNGFIKLKNMGLDPSEKALTSYGNTASSMSKSLNQMIEAVADAATGEFERLKEFGIRANQHGDKVIFTFRGVKTEVGKSSKEIEEYLIKLGENNFAGAMANRMSTLDGAMSNLGDSWDKLFRTISGQGIDDLIASMVRAATQALDWLSDKIKQAGDVWRSAMSDFTSSYASGLGINLDDGVSRVDQLKSAIDTAKKSLAEIHVGALGPSEAQLKAMNELNDKVKIFQREIDAIEGRTLKVPVLSGGSKKAVDRLAQLGGQTGSEGWGDAKQKKTGAGADPRLQEWRAELEEMHTAEQDFFKTSLDEDEKYWQAKLATITGNGKHEQALRRQIEHELYNIHKQQAQQQRQLDEEDIAAKRQRGLDEIEAAREALAIEQEMGEINGQQRVTALRTLLDKEYQLKHQALEDELKLNDLNAVAKAKLLHQLEELDRQHSLKLMKNDAELYAEKKATWGKLLDPVTSAISQSVQAMIMQTATLRKIMANMMQSITGAFAAAIAEQVKDWAKGELAKTALTKQGTITRTFLEKVGLLDVLKTQTSTDTMAAASTQARTAAELPAVANIAGGKAAEAVAPTPWVGPALAAAAFAATVAMIMGSSGHAVGSWNVPGDMVTKVHTGEMIVPEQFAKNVRDGGGLGGGGGTVHLHVNAIDAGSVRRLFKNNGAAIAESLRRQARNFTPMKV